ncbi:MAG: type III-B CRISPR module-associated protein Cmr3 [Bacteroidales bacterium]|nr:type III-B CRISPR module-associated protein Cmr3 [Bacteroidales bacterium]
MRIEIEPFDTLFFRDGKPFTMGDETWADSRFPPFPSVIYGALRSRYFSENIDDFRRLKAGEKLNTDEDPTSELRINQISLYRNKDIFFALPNDLLKEKQGNPNFVYAMKLTKNNAVTGIRENLKLLKPSDQKIYERLQGGLLNRGEFNKYLRNEREFYSFMKLENSVLTEPKTGIGRNYRTRTTAEGKLYRAGMLRLKDLQLVVDFEGLKIDETGFLKLGGEGKAAAYQEIQMASVKMPAINDHFKLYLSTPALFKNGWLPGGIDEQSLEGTIGGINVKLEAAAIGKPVSVGGFDMKKREPKPMYRAVPAGSVYYFSISGNQTDKDKLSAIHGQSISDFRKEEGFGLAYIGIYYKEDT